MDPLGVKMSPIFDLTPFTKEYIDMIIYECLIKGTLYETIDDVQAILKVLENLMALPLGNTLKALPQGTPAYKLSHPNYTKADMHSLVVKFTAIFKALLTEKARLIQ